MTLAELSRASGMPVRRCAALEWGDEPLVSEIGVCATALRVNPGHLLRPTPSARAVTFGHDFDEVSSGLQAAVMRALRGVGRAVLRVVGMGGNDVS
jgi:hypothetical protein